MKQFKYLRVSDPSDEDLDNYGNSGYELVAVVSDYSGHTYIFKQCVEEDFCKISSAKETTPIEKAMKQAIKDSPDSKLGQIRFIRDFMNLSLKEAKDIVDDYWNTF